MPSTYNANNERQYIGARYVPKFATPLAWDTTTAYEALTIVTYNGSSYTSKIPVPPGIEITDGTYWALTGNYNAQIEAYRQDVEKVKTDLNGVKADVGDINAHLSRDPGFVAGMLEGGKKVLLIGDSITKGTGWPGSAGVKTVWDSMFPGNTIVNLGVNSATLAVVPYATASISNTWSSQADKEFDYIFVEGGINDVTVAIEEGIPFFGVMENFFQSPSGLTNGNTLGALYLMLQDMLKHTKNVFYWTPPTTGTNTQLYASAYEMFKRCCCGLGVRVIDVYNMFPRISVDSSVYNDKFHPNQAGYRIVAQLLINGADSTNSKDMLFDGQIIFTNIPLHQLTIPDNIVLTYRTAVSVTKDILANYNPLYMGGMYVINDLTNTFINVTIHKTYRNSFKIIYGGLYDTINLGVRVSHATNTITVVPEYSVHNVFLGSDITKLAQIWSCGTYYYSGNGTLTDGVPEMEGVSSMIHADVWCRPWNEELNSCVIHQVIRVKPTGTTKEWIFEYYRTESGVLSKNVYTVDLTKIS